jgi:XTP/dITP diphosphohydrolase
LAPRGSHGFGYDPVFEVPVLGKTLAEVGPEIKNRLSHRAQAVAKMRAIIQTILSAPDVRPGG